MHSAVHCSHGNTLDGYLATKCFQCKYPTTKPQCSLRNLEVQVTQTSFVTAPRQTTMETNVQEQS